MSVQPILPAQTAAKPQTITTAKGEMLVILPQAEYEALLDKRDEYEAEADVRAFRAKLAAGEEELIPAAVVDRLLAGQETRLKIWREYRGLSSAELARQAGISPSHLSQMENGQKEGSLAVMKKIATTLKLTLDDLV